MDPLEMLDAFEEVTVNDVIHSSKMSYSKEEVTRLLKKSYSDGRQAVYKGEYIFNLEDIDSNIATVSGKEYSIQKLITEDNKYLLIVQVNDVDGNPFTDSDYSILSEELTKAAKIAGNISGVVIIPPGINLSLITAKLDTDKYANSIGLFEEDNNDIAEKIKQMQNNSVIAKQLEQMQNDDAIKEKLEQMQSNLNFISNLEPFREITKNESNRDTLLESLRKLF